MSFLQNHHTIIILSKFHTSELHLLQTDMCGIYHTYAGVSSSDTVNVRVQCEVLALPSSLELVKEIYSVKTSKLSTPEALTQTLLHTGRQEDAQGTEVLLSFCTSRNPPSLFVKSFFFMTDNYEYRPNFSDSVTPEPQRTLHNCFHCLSTAPHDEETDLYV